MVTETTTTKKVKITNRNNGRTGYKIQNGVRRVFEPGQSMNISIEELEALQYEPGGAKLLRDYFIIEDDAALEDLNLNPEPEYFYTETEIETLLKSGSLDQLEDCLNFAPAGVIDMIKTIAVKTELPDMTKREMIANKTGFSVDNAIRINTIMSASTKDGGEAKEEKIERKSKPVETKRKAAPISMSDIL